MKRTVCLLFTLLVSFSVPAFGQERSGPALEKIVRETYRKLEIYNAAAQVFENEQTRKPFRSEANLKFELGDFRSGNVQEIVNTPYAELVTVPSGDVVSLTRGGYAQDGGPQEATFGAAWERGQYASVFDPAWTVADVFHFEAARYYDMRTYLSYRVTVRLDGRSRTYRALALFPEAPDGVPEFWDGIVNGVGSVWEEKRPPYKAKKGIVFERTSPSSNGDYTTSASLSDGGTTDGDSLLDDGTTDGGSLLGDGTSDGGSQINDGTTETLFSSTPSLSGSAATKVSTPPGGTVALQNSRDNAPHY